MKGGRNSGCNGLCLFDKTIKELEDSVRSDPIGFRRILVNFVSMYIAISEYK